MILHESERREILADSRLCANDKALVKIKS